MTKASNGDFFKNTDLYEDLEGLSDKEIDEYFFSKINLYIGAFISYKAKKAANFKIDIDLKLIKKGKNHLSSKIDFHCREVRGD